MSMENGMYLCGSPIKVLTDWCIVVSAYEGRSPLENVAVLGF